MINEDQLISVIIPVYNVAPYLESCVDSILNQTYKNLELIFVVYVTMDIIKLKIKNINALNYLQGKIML